MKKFRLLPSACTGLLLPCFVLILLSHGMGFTRTPAYERFRVSSTELQPLRFANPLPSSRFSRREFLSMGEALAHISENRAIYKYFRDTLGINQAVLDVEVDSDTALVALRKRVIVWMDGLQLRYEVGESRATKSGLPERFGFNFGALSDPQVYYRLRDSLISLRSTSIRVRVEENPYREDLEMDSVAWFLQTLHAAQVENKDRFERFFLKQFGRNDRALNFYRERGLEVRLELKRPLTQSEWVEGQSDVPRLRNFQLNQSILGNKAGPDFWKWVSLALGVTCLVLILILIVMLLRHRRRNKRGPPQV